MSQNNLKKTTTYDIIDDAKIIWDALCTKPNKNKEYIEKMMVLHEKLKSMVHIKMRQKLVVSDKH